MEAIEFFLKYIPSVIAVGISVFALYSNHLYREKDRQLDIAMKLHSRWNEDQLIDSRRKIWQLLDKIEKINEEDVKKSWSEIIREDPELRASFSNLHHFIMDVKSLIDENLVEKRVFQTLVGNTVCRFIERIEARIHYDDLAYRDRFNNLMKPLLIVFPDYPKFYQNSFTRTSRRIKPSFRRNLDH